MNKKQSSSDTAVEKKAENSKAPKFTVEQLRENAFKLFGITQSTFVGATYNLDGEYTVQEMKDHINKWLTKEVK